MNAEAFNAGCDARLAGKPLSANPYRRCDENDKNINWRMGWNHVDSWWGEDATWPYRCLPEVCGPLAGTSAATTG